MASGNIKGITIEFKGDTTQLGKALSQVNKEIRATDSALRDIDKALKLDPGNVDLLTQKEGLLAKQIEQTKQKLDLQKQAATEAAKALANGTISQEEYAKLSAELATTANKLDKLETEAKQTSDALNGAGKETEDAGNKAEASGEKWSKFGDAAKVACAAAAAGVAAVTAAVTASVKALADFSTAGAHYADDILTMSAVTGVSAERLQELSYAAELVDVPVETIAGALTKVEKSMLSASNGTKSTAEAYAALGVSVTNADGSLRSSEAVLFEAVDALGKIENETERDTLAMTLFGKSAKELNPLIKAGSGALEEYAQQAHDVGYVLSDDTLDAFGEFDDTLVKLENGTKAAKNALGTVLLPVLTKIGGEGVDLLGDFSKAVLGTNGDLDKVGEVVNEFVPKVVGMVQTYVPQFLQIATTILTAIVTAITSNIEPIVTAGMQIIEALVSGISEQGPPLIAAVTDALVLIAQTLITPENLEMVINGAVQIIVAVVSGLAKALPKLIPAVVQAILTIVKTLTSKDNLTAVLNAATQILMAVASGILSVLPELIPTVLEIFTTIIGQILDPTNLNNVITSAIQIIMAIVQGLTNALPQLIPAVVQAITTITAELSKPENLLLVIEAAVSIIAAVVEGLIKALPDLAAGLVQITTEIVNSLSNLAKDAVTWGADMIKSFVKGIKDNIPSLGEAASGAAKKVKDFLGFSEPKDGPLSNFHTFAPDMMDLYAEGIDENINVVQKSVDDVAGVVAGGMTQQPDYSGALGTISGQLSAAIGGGKQIVIPVYIGQERLDTLVVNAQNRANFLSGGR